MPIATINPATGETVQTFEEMSDADVERALAVAAAAHASYRLTTFGERADWMRRAAEILDGEQDKVAAMMTTEMGKTLAAARQEVAKCATACRYYAEHAAGFLADEAADAAAVGAEQAYARYQPAWSRFGDHAVELPALAGDALRGPGADGRQHRAAEARVERAADGAFPAGTLRQGRLPRRDIPDAAHRFCQGRGSPARRSRGRRDADRLRSRRAVGRGDRGQRGKESRARARRQ